MFDLDGLQSLVLLLITCKDQALLLERLPEALETEVGEDTATDLFSLLLRHLLVRFHPLHLNAVALFHQLALRLLREEVLHLRAVITLSFLVIDFGFHRHSDALLDDGEEEDE